MNPLGRIAFEQLHRFGQRHGRTQAEKDVHMIGTPPIARACMPFFAGGPSEVRSKPSANLAGEHGRAAFAGEDAMEEGRNALFRPFPRTLLVFVGDAQR